MRWRRKVTNGEGALISADVIDLRSNRLTNSGTIVYRSFTLLNTESLNPEIPTTKRCF